MKRLTKHTSPPFAIGSLLEHRHQFLVKFTSSFCWSGGCNLSFLYLQIISFSKKWRIIRNLASAPFSNALGLNSRVADPVTNCVADKCHRKENPWHTIYSDCVIFPLLYEWFPSLSLLHVSDVLQWQGQWLVLYCHVHGQLIKLVFIRDFSLFGSSFSPVSVKTWQ